jgi:phosphoribosyl-AMP cyclohydrolase
MSAITNCASKDLPVSAQIDSANPGKAFFLALEQAEFGDARPLSETLDMLRFDEKGLVPVVTQDADSGDVLMLAWMNLTAIQQTLKSGRVTYFSRSRNSLWVKGLTSGNTQQLVELRIDCDGDALLCRVTQTGSACHTLRRSSFYLAPDQDQQHVHVCSKPESIHEL